MDPVELREAGKDLLIPVLAAHGFEYMAGDVGRSSGGRFAQAAFVRNDAQLEFSVRHALGEVVYRVGNDWIRHEDYVRLVAPTERPRYPGFSDDPLDAFRDLAADLARFGAAFFERNPQAFRQLVADAAANPRPSGLRALSQPPDS